MLKCKLIEKMVVLTLTVPSPARPVNKDPHPGISSVMLLVIHKIISTCTKSSLKCFFYTIDTLIHTHTYIYIVFKHRGGG